MKQNKSLLDALQVSYGVAVNNRLLFVCRNNICRSTLAESIMRHMLEKQDLANACELASAATHGVHIGAPPDSLVLRAAERRGYVLCGAYSKKIGWHDLEYFDRILAMDRASLEHLRRLAHEDRHGRIELLMQYATHHFERDVPDPYLSLGRGFDEVIDMIEDACRGLIDALLQNGGTR